MWWLKDGLGDHVGRQQHKVRGPRAFYKKYKY